jgi:DNA-binding NtrC family response regulator
MDFQYGRSMREIHNDAVLKFALSQHAGPIAEAASFLGISAKELRDLTKKYNIKNFFEETDKKDLTDNL